MHRAAFRFSIAMKIFKRENVAQEGHNDTPKIHWILYLSLILILRCSYGF